MDRIHDLYEKVKPIADLVEHNKKAIDMIASDIEDDESVSDKDWYEIEELMSSLLNLSFSGGHTAINTLKNMAVIDTEK